MVYASINIEIGMRKAESGDCLEILI